MSTLVLHFANASNCRAFCTWYASCLAGSELARSNDPCCVRVVFPTQYARTVMTVAQYNGALVEKAA